ncbi:MAG TPA: hypothetical protein VD902_09140, partial [Symbiobacteriaceae bacterium]|nr:hypothetical protein [Symbiobacteriaceae bacterium]
PDGTVKILTLNEDWTATLTAPPDRTGEITLDLGPGKARAVTLVEPVRFRLTGGGPVTWSFLDGVKGQPVRLTLTGETTGPVASPAVIPPYTGLEEQGPWAPDGARRYTTQAAVTLEHPPKWTSLKDLLVGRRFDLTLTPAAGPYLAGDSLQISAQVAPLIPWYRLLPALVLLAGAVWLIYRRLYGGPQLPIAIGGVHLMGRRPGVMARLLNPRTQREITVGGISSPAAVKLKELPPDALLKVSARGIPGRERFRLENLNRSLPMLFKGLLQRNRINLKGKGPAPAISVGDFPLHVLLHPKRPRR